MILFLHLYNVKQGQGTYENAEDAGKEAMGMAMYDERTGGAAGAQAAGMSANYAAAMAGLAGFQYTGGQTAANAAFLNPSHYPAYAAAQYNAALAAGYWPGPNQPGASSAHAAASTNVGAGGERGSTGVSQMGQFSSGEKAPVPKQQEL